MASRQPLYFGQRGIDGLSVERSPALEECFLVTEIADVRAATRDHNRVRDEIQLPLDQVTPDRRKIDQCAYRGPIQPLRTARLPIVEKSRPCVLTGTDEDRVRMGSRL